MFRHPKPVEAELFGDLDHGDGFTHRFGTGHGTEQGGQVENGQFGHDGSSPGFSPADCSIAPKASASRILADPGLRGCC